MFIEFESTIRKIITIFEGIGVNEKDSDEIKLQKATLVAASFTMATLAIIWGSLYLYLDLVISASIPLTYCVLSYISIFTFHKSKNINFFRNSQLFFIVFLPFFLMLSLGGFVSSSVVIIWAVLGPFGALLFSNFKHAPLWFFLFIILTIIGGYVGYINYFPEPVISEFFVQIFFYMNIIAVFSLIFILFYYFINQKEIAVRLLKVLAENEFSDLINKMELEEKIVHDQKDLTPVFFLIVNEGGISIYSKSFSETAQFNEQLIGGFLSAINCFGQEAFGAHILKQMSYKDFHLLFELNPFKQKLIYAFNGDQDKAEKQMEKLLEKINEDEEIVKILEKNAQISLNSHPNLNHVINSVLG